MSNTNGREGLLFRDKPFLIALMYERVTSPAQRLTLLLELMNEHVLYHTTFQLTEVGN